MHSRVSVSKSASEQLNSRRRRETGIMVSGNTTTPYPEEPHVFPNGNTLTSPAIQKDDKESKKVGDYYEYYYDEIDVNTTVFLLKDLKHYSSYSIYVRACREGKNDNCSNESIIQQKTARIGKRHTIIPINSALIN